MRRYDLQNQRNIMKTILRYAVISISERAKAFNQRCYTVMQGWCSDTYEKTGLK